MLSRCGRPLESYHTVFFFHTLEGQISNTRLNMMHRWLFINNYLYHRDNNFLWYFFAINKKKKTLYDTKRSIRMVNKFLVYIQLIFYTKDILTTMRINYEQNTLFTQITVVLYCWSFLNKNFCYIFIAEVFIHLSW